MGVLAGSRPDGVTVTCQRSGEKQLYFVPVLSPKGLSLIGSCNLYNYYYESMFILQARGISVSTYASGLFQVNRFLYTTVLDNSIQFPQFVFLYQQRVSISIGCIHCSATCALSQQ